MHPKQRGYWIHRAVCQDIYKCPLFSLHLKSCSFHFLCPFLIITFYVTRIKDFQPQVVRCPVRWSAAELSLSTLVKYWGENFFTVLKLHKSWWKFFLAKTGRLALFMCAPFPAAFSRAIISQVQVLIGHTPLKIHPVFWQWDTCPYSLT